MKTENQEISLRIPRIISGASCIERLAEKINNIHALVNAKILIVSSQSQKLVVENSILPQFKKFNCEVQILITKGEPDCKLVDQFRKSITEVRIIWRSVTGRISFCSQKNYRYFFQWGIRVKLKLY